MIKQITIETEAFTLEVRGASLSEALNQLEKLLPYVETLDGTIKMEEVEVASAQT